MVRWSDGFEPSTQLLIDGCLDKTDDLGDRDGEHTRVALIESLLPLGIAIEVTWVGLGLPYQFDAASQDVLCKTKSGPPHSFVHWLLT